VSETSRSAILAQIASAVQAAVRRPEPGVREPLDPKAGYVGCPGEPVETFAAELEQLGGKTIRISNSDEARAALDQILNEHKVSRVAVNPDPLLERYGVLARLRERQGLEVLTPTELARLEPVKRRDILFQTQLGIAVPDWGVAETGTLVYCCGPDKLRSTSLVPPVLLALLDRTSIVPDLFDLFERRPFSRPDQMPSNVVLVTGPSKTADIELILTKGVHGPGTVYVMICG